MMTDDLVKRLQKLCPFHDNPHTVSKSLREAASRIEELEKRVQQAKIVFATMHSEMVNVCAVMKAFENDE